MMIAAEVLRDDHQAGERTRMAVLVAELAAAQQDPGGEDRAPSRGGDRSQAGQRKRKTAVYRRTG